MGVDNALIEMDANEPPIGDGSAQPYRGADQEGRHRRADACRGADYEITEPIHLETKSGSLMTIVPDPTFRISCTQVGPDGRFTQFYSTEITPAIYEKEIAPARTFVFYEDVKPLMDKGLIKGGSLENAVVVRGDSVLSKEPLRFTDEFVRHKILDIVGDLALFGRAIKGHVIAVKPGHGPNTELARAIAKQLRASDGARAAERHAEGRRRAGRERRDEAAAAPLPVPDGRSHRRASKATTKCTGVKNVTINEHYFQGHFPGHPIMPGVLQLEAMAQVGSILLLRTARQRREDRLLHERGRGEIPQAGRARRHALHRGGDHAAEARHRQGARALHRE